MHRRHGDVLLNGHARVGFVLRVAVRLLDSRGLERVALQHLLEAAIVPLRLDSGGRVRNVERWYVDGGVGIHVSILGANPAGGCVRVGGRDRVRGHSLGKESAEAMTPLALAGNESEVMLLLLLEPQRHQRLVVEQLGSLVRLDYAEVDVQRRISRRVKAPLVPSTWHMLHGKAEGVVPWLGGLRGLDPLALVDGKAVGVVFWLGGLRGLDPLALVNGKAVGVVFWLGGLRGLEPLALVDGKAVGVVFWLGGLRGLELTRAGALLLWLRRSDPKPCRECQCLLRSVLGVLPVLQELAARHAVGSCLNGVFEACEHGQPRADPSVDEIQRATCAMSNCSEGLLQLCETGQLISLQN